MPIEPARGLLLLGNHKSKHLREFQDRKTTLVKEARSLTEHAASKNRELTGKEVSSFDALRTRNDASSVAIGREAALIADENG